MLLELNSIWGWVENYLNGVASSCQVHNKSTYLSSFVNLNHVLLQLVRQLQGQDGDVVGEEVPTTPKKIFQLLNEVILNV